MVGTPLALYSVIVVLVFQREYGGSSTGVPPEFSAELRWECGTYYYILTYEQASDTSEKNGAVVVNIPAIKKEEGVVDDANCR